MKRMAVWQALTSSNQCIVMQTPLLDGSECGWAGRCYNQTCNEGSWQAQFESMYKQNLQISIPVTIVVGLIVSIELVGMCIISPKWCLLRWALQHMYRESGVADMTAPRHSILPLTILTSLLWAMRRPQSTRQESRT